MKISILEWFLLSAVCLTVIRIIPSYLLFKTIRSRDSERYLGGNNLLHLFIKIIGNSIIALALTVGPTFTYIDKNMNYHGTQYSSILIAVTAGGALGGFVLYCWERFLNSKLPANDAK